MSFRETRSLLEMLRSLGYPTQIGMESFKQPNFPLLADVLLWLAKSYDPMMELTLDIQTEQDRVHFIKSITIAIASKAHLILNPKRLYAADAYSVKELLKIALILYEAKNALHDKSEINEAKMMSLTQDNFKVDDLKQARILAANLTNHGAQLYDLLAKEVDLREARTMAISRQMDLQAIENQIQGHIKAVRDQNVQTRRVADDLKADEHTLDAKLDKRKQELDRLEKRLNSLKGVRPAFMDEYERLEKEVQKYYVQYVEKFRNLTYLEHQLDEFQKIKQDQNKKQEQALVAIQTSVRAEELSHLREGEDVIMDDKESLDLESETSQSQRLQSGQSRVGTSAKNSSFSIGRQSGEFRESKSSSVGDTKAKVRGNILGGDDDDDETEIQIKPSSRASARPSTVRGPRSAAAREPVNAPSLEDSDSDFGADEAESLMGPANNDDDDDF